MEMKEVHRKAFKEAYVILKYLNKKDYRKIPRITIKTIKKNMDLDYYYEVNENFELYEQDMLPETKALLTNLYRDYLASEEERKKIIEKQNKERIKNEKKKEEKNNPSKMFEDREKSEIVIPKPLQDAKPIEGETKHNLPIEVKAKKENIFRHIINLIKEKFNLY